MRKILECYAATGLAQTKEKPGGDGAGNRKDSGAMEDMKMAEKVRDKQVKKSGASMESVVEEELRESKRERSYEHGLPDYLQHDLDAFKEGMENKSDLLDCLWGELYGSINIAEINEGVITPEHADYLRQKYLW